MYNDAETTAYGWGADKVGMMCSSLQNPAVSVLPVGTRNGTFIPIYGGSGRS